MENNEEIVDQPRNNPIRTIKYFRYSKLAGAPIDYFAIGFSFFIYGAGMMKWVNYKGEYDTLNQVLYYFGGVATFIIGILNWYQGKGLLSFIDFTFSLFNMVFSETLVNPDFIENHHKLLGTFLVFCLVVLLVLIVCSLKKVMILVLSILLLFADIFGLVWEFKGKKWAMKTSGYFLFFSAIVLWLTAVFKLLAEETVPALKGLAPSDL